MITKSAAKKILGDLPFTAETYWYIRQAGKPIRTGYSLKKDGLPERTSRLPGLESATRQEDTLCHAALLISTPPW
jgi:hypothetical protein